MYRPETFIREWIGTIHVYNGRDKKGVDCYGLVVAYYRDVLGITLPDWECEDSSCLWVARFMEKQVRDRLEVIEAPEDHCIAVIKRCSAANHVGIVYGGGLLHCLENAATVYQPLSLASRLYGNPVYGRPILEVEA